MTATDHAGTSRVFIPEELGVTHRAARPGRRPLPRASLTSAVLSSIVPVTSACDLPARPAFVPPACTLASCPY